jgi:hypothetical protein
MTTSRTKLAYYNRTLWRTVLLADGTRAVQPLLTDGGPTNRATTRYYRKHSRAHG